MWDRRVFEKIDLVVGSFSVLVLLKGVSDGFEWIRSGVYGLTNGSLRDAMWAELDSVRSRWEGAWCLFGDFNVIRYLAERLGCNSFSLAMFKFSDFIAKHHFEGPPSYVLACKLKALKGDLKHWNKHVFGDVAF